MANAKMINGGRRNYRMLAWMALRHMFDRSLVFINKIKMFFNISGECHLVYYIYFMLSL